MARLTITPTPIPAGSIGASLLTDPGTGKVWGSNGAGSAAAVRPPGYQWDYATQTSNVTISGTNETDVTAVVTGNSVTYDGAAVKVSFSAYFARCATTGTVVFYIMVDGISVGLIGNLANDGASSVQAPVCFWTVITPSAGAHIISIAASKTTGNGLVGAGAGGNSNPQPISLQVTKV